MYLLRWWRLLLWWWWWWLLLLLLLQLQLVLLQLVLLLLLLLQLLLLLDQPLLRDERRLPVSCLCTQAVCRLESPETATGPGGRRRVELELGGEQHVFCRAGHDDDGGGPRGGVTMRIRYGLWIWRFVEGGYAIPSICRRFSVSNRC